jgi:hypothetical protein
MPQRVITGQGLVLRPQTTAKATTVAANRAILPER